MKGATHRRVRLTMTARRRRFTWGRLMSLRTRQNRNREDTHPKLSTPARLLPSCQRTCDLLQLEHKFARAPSLSQQHFLLAIPVLASVSVGELRGEPMMLTTTTWNLARPNGLCLECTERDAEMKGS